MKTCGFLLPRPSVSRARGNNSYGFSLSRKPFFPRPQKYWINLLPHALTADFETFIVRR
ncbi:hypothetical protein HMPREF3293_01041 [Christensenella minuta]|uniref:Uncharacterized protein n=1 Tax=Christensenella minuta TaxID=626937 RepID=A0A136Q6T0_9FIRM|nr:hypothetical protein HMPREF3293_01041 [Christensenella minuta]